MYQPKYRFAAFDMDGTLLDSMHQLRGAAAEYLEQVGLQELADEKREELFFTPIPTAVQNVAAWCEERGLPPLTMPKLFEILRKHYATDVTLKPGIVGFLELLKKNGVRMCVLTATWHELCDDALRIAGLDQYFDFVMTATEDFPTGKGSPEVFEAMLTRLGAKPEECAMVEDAYYSIRTAKSLGMHIIAIEDDIARRNREKILELADEYYTAFPQE